MITDGRIYLNKERNAFKIGTKKEAEEAGWVSWEVLRKEYKSEEELARFLLGLTGLTKEEMLAVAGDADKFWAPFEEKITRFNVLLSVKDIFQKYSEHVLRKYIANGYDRVEFRALLIGLK